MKSDDGSTQLNLSTGGQRSFHFFSLMIAIAVGITFTPTFYRLAAYGWKSADFTHAYFILPIFLFIIWLRRTKLVAADSINLSGLIFSGLGLLAYMFAAINAFMFLEAASFVLVMWGLFRLRLTDQSFKHCIFPLSYLVFLIPPPSIVIDSLTFPLKQIASQGSHLLLSLFNLPVKLYGVILKVGEHELFIADACSGFRSIVTLLSLGAVYVYFQPTTTLRKWIIFASLIPIALLSNIFRISLTGIIAFYWGAEKAEGFFHDFSGLVLFMMTVLCLMGVTKIVCREPRA